MAANVSSASAEQGCFQRPTQDPIHSDIRYRSQLFITTATTGCVWESAPHAHVPVKQATLFRPHHNRLITYSVIILFIFRTHNLLSHSLQPWLATLGITSVQHERDPNALCGCGLADDYSSSAMVWRHQPAQQDSRRVC